MDKYLDKSNGTLIGIAFLILGFILLYDGTTIYTSLVNIFVILFLLFSLLECLKILMEKNKKIKKERYSLAIINLVFAIIMLLIPNIPLSIIPILFGIYLLLHSIIKFITYYFMRRDKAQGKNYTLIIAVFFFVLGTSVVTSPLSNLKPVIIFFGIYCILLGLTNIFIVIPLPIKQKIRICLPPIVDMFMPITFLNKFNRFITERDSEDMNLYVTKKSMDTPDMEILVHVSKKGFNQIGHMDLCIDDTVISYGNYDISSSKFNELIGDGVLFEAPRDKYIKLCIEHSEKTLIGFGLKLSGNQKKKVLAEVEKIKKAAVNWEVPIKTDKKAKDYASILYNRTKAQFYKFSYGKYKTYSVFYTNCSLLADQIIRKSGTDILKIAGVITPGTYLDYLEHEFTIKNSNVISKKVYNKDSKEKIV